MYTFLLDLKRHQLKINTSSLKIEQFSGRLKIKMFLRIYYASVQLSQFFFYYYDYVKHKFCKAQNPLDTFPLAGSCKT